MGKNIKFITEEKGVKVYEYSFNGDNIFILQESNKEIVFQAKKAILRQFEQSDEYHLVREHFSFMATQEQIRANEIRLERLRRELGIKPKMGLICCSKTPTEPTFNLRDLNKELITINRNKVSK